MAGGSLDVAVILGSGLSEAFETRSAFEALPYERFPGSPQATLEGHPGHALAGEWAGRRVALFGGRVHLYQGFRADEVVYFVRLAAAAGARALVVTNAAGALEPTLAPGDILLIGDQINLTGTAPPMELADEPSVEMVDAYSPRLRALARAIDPSLREGIYAGVRGPYYETPAEARALRVLGADAVGMSTVLETMAARALGLEVLGFSFITNAIGTTSATTHANVLAVAGAGADRLAAIVESVIAKL